MQTDYSIIIPAYNEEALLGGTIAALRAAMETVALKGELLVVDNNSSDRTAALAEALGAKVVFEPLNQISRARNAGARAAKGRYLVFVDADTLIPPKLLQKALNNLESGRCCGGGAKVWAAGKPKSMLKAAMGYWNFVSKTAKVAAGCFVYARADDFKACGGFSEKYYATEEIWFSLAIKKHAKGAGRKFMVIEDPAATTSTRKLEWFKYSLQLIMMLTVCMFPFLGRFKWACGFWYGRPEAVSKETPSEGLQ